MKAELLGKRWSVSPLFFPLLIWMMAVRGSTDTAAFLLALFLHEGGHMLMAGAFGMEVAEIRLLPFGCAAKMPGIDFCDAHTEVFVAAAGPAAVDDAALPKLNSANPSARPSSTVITTASM